MCLIVAAWRVHPRFPLVLAANRDEFHQRPSAPAARWDDPAGLTGGRDLEAGGTWLAVDTAGRVAAVTNVREHRPPPDQARSRGELPLAFLGGTADAHACATKLLAAGECYRGFNLLLGDRDTLMLASNRHPRVLELQPGLHAVSNACPGEDWPKAKRARAALADALAHDQRNGVQVRKAVATLTATAFALLADTSTDADDGDALGAIFVTGERYGTRASTVVLRDTAGAVHFHERRFGPLAREQGETRLTLPARAA